MKSWNHPGLDFNVKAFSCEQFLSTYEYNLKIKFPEKKLLN